MPFNWTKCVICQKSTKEVLKCPLNSLQPDDSKNKDDYVSFCDNVEAFRQLADLIPLEINSDVTRDNLIKNRGSWHKSCRLKFSKSKLEKARERCKRKRSSDCINESQDGILEKRISRSSLNVSEYCMFCNSPATSQRKLLNVRSLTFDKNVRCMATELEDFQLLGRISGGDLVAIEGKYHLDCLTNYRNRYRSLTTQMSKDSEDVETAQIIESRTFVELTEHITKCVENGNYILKLSELHNLYVNRLNDLGLTKMVNKTRLKAKLLDHFSEEGIEEKSDGKNTLLLFSEGMNHLLQEALKRNYANDLTVLAQAAKVIRKDILSHNGFSFEGHFPDDCQKESIPTSLLSLVSMILYGLDIKDQEKSESQPCLTISQTILFNAKSRLNTTKSNKTRHSSSREPPLPLYLGLSLHSLTRSKNIIAKLYHMGLCVSYDRIMEIEEWLANSVSKRFDEDGSVTPVALRKGLFCVGGLDNLDHNPSSTTAVSSFHGTAISVFQFPMSDNEGETRPALTIPPSDDKKHQLPENYATVHPVALDERSVTIPEREMTRIGSTIVDESKIKENQWVCHTLSKIGKEDIDASDAITWASFHSSRQPAEDHIPALSGMLPLFYEKAATPAMMTHGMNVLKQAIHFLNPNQIPVITLDQPLFALAKIIQWKWPDVYGEDR